MQTTRRIRNVKMCCRPACSAILHRLRVGKKIRHFRASVEYRCRKKSVLRKQSCKKKKKRRILATYLQQNHCVRRERLARDIFFIFFLFFFFLARLSREWRALPPGFVTRRVAVRLQAFEECICTARQSCGAEKGRGEGKGWKWRRSGSVRRGYRHRDVDGEPCEWESRSLCAR